MDEQNIGYRIPKALLSAILGLIVIAAHMTLAAYTFSLSTLDELAAVEIAAPITITYAITVVRWFVDNQGDLPRAPTVGITYVILVVMLFGGAILSLFTILYYHNDNVISVASANVFITAVEAVFGALLVLIMNDLFPARVV